MLNLRFNIYTDYQQNQSIFASIGNIITQHSHQTVVIHPRETIEDIYLVELIKKSRFSYLTLKLASKYGMLRLIDDCITFELLARDFIFPKQKSVSKHHEQIRTLENIVGLDKAGMIISPEIGLHENVAVLDFNDEYANIITRQDISYENLSSDVVITKEIETWRGFIDNLPSDEDKVVLTLVQQFLEIPLNCFLFILIQPDI